MPPTVDASRIEASHKDGVLEIVLPKLEQAKPRKIEIRAASATRGGKIEVRSALPREAGEVDHYPRIALRFNRRSVGRLRQLIDRLNSFVGEPPPSGDASPHEIVAAELPPEAERAEQEEG